MNHHKSTIRRILLSRQGKENAIKGSVIARNIGIDYRKVREIIHELRVEDKIPIGSSCKNNQRGYYLCMTQEEREENYRSLKSRGISIFRCMAVFRETTPREVMRQLELEL